MFMHHELVREDDAVVLVHWDDEVVLVHLDDEVVLVMRFLGNKPPMI